MKTIDSLLIRPDPVMSEVRSIKTALAAKHNFDVMAMIQSLQDREQKQKIERTPPNACLRPASC
jgi:hypothetical protein